MLVEDILLHFLGYHQNLPSEIFEDVKVAYDMMYLAFR